MPFRAMRFPPLPRDDFAVIQAAKYAHVINPFDVVAQHLKGGIVFDMMSLHRPRVLRVAVAVYSFRGCAAAISILPTKMSKHRACP